MPRNVFYDTNDLELVKSRLRGILTCDEKTAATLAKTAFRHEVLDVATIFNGATESLHHKWASAILGNVPLEAWVKGPHGENQIEPNKDASLRLWSLDGPDQLEENLLVGKVRQQVFVRLLKAMPPVQQKHYKPMLSWINDQTEAPVELASGPLGSDTIFGHVLACLERWMEAQLHESEKLWVLKHEWPKGRSVPSAVTRELSSQALEHFKNILSRWFEEDSTNQQVASNSLLALISANLSANRVLLEFAAKEARGREAAGLAIDILEKLNKRGITEVPIEMDRLSPRDRILRLRDGLTSWFGPEGLLIGPNSEFKRPMNYSDIDFAVKRSVHLQENYISTRGRRGGPQEARENHGKSPNLFIFSLTLIGAFYNNSKTDNEFKGKSNSSYAVFPGRKILSKGVDHVIPPHADELLKQAYGQIYFGNDDWDLLANGVRRYAETASIKRAHIEQLIYFAIKGRQSSCLLGLSKRLSETKDNPPPIYENSLTHR
ncbi:hypothetical protein [Pseudomonas viridiflava]|uniref:hypothetical protein n=1 Tax=Pseudomonas viridiflava TaxID=33069 RepID=UPI000F055D01|nr:hypothetical protein [Pseudomonas viridiflava]